MLDVDYALVGGGLQNGLVALALRAHQPHATIALVERGRQPGGNHTWCFHAGDLPGRAADWVEPLVVARWSGYDVAFPARRRTVASPYACVTSARFAARVNDALAADGCHLVASSEALVVTANSVLVRARDGRTDEIRARAVIDARGPERAAVARTGWQKFVGQELRLAAPHGLVRPMLIDATVAQLDGLRFCYVLPLAPDRALVEDTYFSDTTHLDVTALRARIGEYVAARGWQIAEVVREETGVLPMPWRCDPPAAGAPLVAGYAGGWFHPGTGYSFPIAVRLAELVASLPAERLCGDELAAHARAHAAQQRFASRLNRMMFTWFPPHQRFRALERFYRLPEPLIRRFYALELTAMDRARILIGLPPRGMSVAAALGVAEAS